MSQVQQLSRKSHPFRLGAYMLGGVVFFSLFFQPVQGNLLDEWYQAAPLIYPVTGAIFGLMAELMHRIINPES